MFIKWSKKCPKIDQMAQIWMNLRYLITCLGNQGNFSLIGAWSDERSLRRSFKWGLWKCRREWQRLLRLSFRLRFHGDDVGQFTFYFKKCALQFPLKIWWVTKIRCIYWSALWVASLFKMTIFPWKINCDFNWSRFLNYDVHEISC